MERGEESRSGGRERRSPLSWFRGSLTGRFSVLLLALLIPLAVVGVTIGQALSANAEALRQALRVKELAVRSFALVLTQDDVTKQILLDPARISEAEHKIDAYDENREILGEIGALTSDAEMLRILAALDELDNGKLRPLDSRILEATFGSGAGEARRIYFEEYEPLRRDYLRLGRDLTRRAEEVALRVDAELQARNRRSLVNVAAALLVGIALVALVIRLVTRNIQRRMDLLMAFLERVAHGELRPPELPESPDEIGRIGAALSDAVREMRNVLLGVSETSNRLEAQTLSIARASGVVAKVASQQGQEVTRATESMERATEQVWGIAESARVLGQMVDESRATIDAIAQMSDGFRRRSDLLNDQIEETSASIDGMGASLSQVEASVEVLAGAAHETSSSANEMAVSMGSVDEVVRTSEARWTEMVAHGQRGLAKVEETIVGIEAVRKTTATAQEVVQGLAGRAAEIGSILDVINEVADETNLLALNANIIAAQAGDNGRAFSVVAQEIRGLAERVTTHTSQIERLITAVQAESGNALEAIGQGSSSVSTVVELSQEAGEVVQQMTRSSQENAVQLKEIAGAVREQNHAAKQVVALMTRTDHAVDEIREALQRQTSGSRTALDSTTEMQGAAKAMSVSAVEQAESLQQVADSVAKIREAAQAAEGALEKQTTSTLEVAEFLEKVDRRSAENTRSAELTFSATEQLQELVESLRREVSRFKL